MSGKTQRLWNTLLAGQGLFLFAPICQDDHVTSRRNLIIRYVSPSLKQLPASLQ